MDDFSKLDVLALCFCTEVEADLSQHRYLSLKPLLAFSVQASSLKVCWEMLLICILPGTIRLEKHCAQMLGYKLSKVTVAQEDLCWGNSGVLCDTTTGKLNSINSSDVTGRGWLEKLKRSNKFKLHQILIRHAGLKVQVTWLLGDSLKPRIICSTSLLLIFDPKGILSEERSRRGSCSWCSNKCLLNFLCIICASLLCN